MINWTDIASFHNVVKLVKTYNELLNNNSKVLYKSKIKLHGTNAAIQCRRDGFVVPQSRTKIISVNDDNNGFAKFVKENEDSFRLKNDLVLFGEWCGRGIQKGVAISNISNKIFAVFAIRSVDENNDIFIVEPSDIQNIIGNIPNVYVLPWENEIELDLFSGEAGLTNPLNTINNWVNSIEENDPWVEKTFDVKGIGEGLVFYPVSNEHQGYKSYSNLTFKAKGEKHKNIKTAKPASISAEAAANINQFAEMVLTTARLEQGATSIISDGPFDIKLVGKFLAWVLQDVIKECQDELEASGLEWKRVQRTVSDVARNWYIAKTKLLG